MIEYRNIRCKSFLALLTVMACIIGCGSMHNYDSLKAESASDVPNPREVYQDTPEMRVAEKRERSKIPEKEVNRHDYYLNEDNGKRVDSEVSDQKGNVGRETGLRGAHDLETGGQNVGSEKKSESQSAGYDETGIAAFISDEYDGAMTASGVRYDRNEMTAAHPSLPFDTKIVVTNLRNRRSVEVIIIDRFDPSTDRILNLSHRAAEELDLIESGIAKVGIRKVAD